EIERLLLLAEGSGSGVVEVPYWLNEEMVLEGMKNGYLGNSAVSLYLSTHDDTALSLELKERGKSLLRRSLLMGMIQLVSLVGMIFATVHLLRSRSRSGPQWRVVRVWDSSLILAVFFSAEIIGSLLSDYFFSSLIYE
ncbi:hypothetical protein N9Z83_02155, partial [Akkermansiaceae bacterium]|nr:hypothetical protein [Akkermansiaceae bacterium]